MKKLLLGLIILTLTSCDSSNFKEINEESSIPKKVLTSIKDTTLVFNKCFVETKNYTYVLSKNPKETVVEQVIPKESSEGITFWVGVIIGLFVGLFVVLCIISAFD